MTTFVGTPIAFKYFISNERSYFRVFIYEGMYEIMVPSPIRFNIRRYASVFSIEVKSKYQIAILDTTDDFDKMDYIQEIQVLP